MGAGSVINATQAEKGIRLRETKLLPLPLDKQLIIDIHYAYVIVLH